MEDSPKWILLDSPQLKTKYEEEDQVDSVERDCDHHDPGNKLKRPTSTCQLERGGDAKEPEDHTKDYEESETVERKDRYQQNSRCFGSHKARRK